MKKINVIIVLVTFCLAANAQLNLNGLLNKNQKEESSNSNSAIEMLFSSKINKDASKNGIEFKNEFGVNDELYFSFYFPKTINKILSNGNVSLVFLINDKQVVACSPYVNTDFSEFQFPLNFKGEFQPVHQDRDYPTDIRTKRDLAKYFDYLNASSEENIKVTIKLSGSKKAFGTPKEGVIAEASYTIKKKKGEVVATGRTFEKDNKALNNGQELIKRCKALWSQSNATQDTCKMVDLRLIEADWTTISDNLTGTILYRKIAGATKFQRKNGTCYYSWFEFREKFNGKEYQIKSLGSYYIPEYGAYNVECDCK